MGKQPADSIELSGIRRLDMASSIAAGAVKKYQMSGIVVAEGITELVGPPSVNLSEAMELEHMGSLDSLLPFTAPNYGTRTTSSVEHHFVIYGEEKIRYIADVLDILNGIEECGFKYPIETEKGRKELEDHNGKPRVAIPHTEMADQLNERNELLQHQGFDPVGAEEFIAARLYTGPM